MGATTRTDGPRRTRWRCLLLCPLAALAACGDRADLSAATRLAGARTAIAAPAAARPGAGTEAPVIAPIDVRGEPRVNNPLAFGADFTDIDPRDRHLARWSWGDGSQAPASVHCKHGAGSIAGRHAYRKPGVYTVQLSVLDSGGKRASVTRQVVVHGAAADAFNVSASGLP